nr:MAG TPA: hypothetical protein [Caudoviricetes sp.]
MPIFPLSSDDNIALHEVVCSFENFPIFAKDWIVWNIFCVA